MKIRTILTALFIAAIAFNVAAEKDQESTHVEVTLTDSTKIEGYLRNDLKTGLKNLFSKSGSIIQYINVGDEPKGGETKRYSAADVIEYRFLEKSEEYPEGAVVVSELINAPMMFKPNNCTRGFAWELDRNDVGKILTWSVYEQTGGRNSVSRLVPVIGVKLKGAKAAYGMSINGRMNFMMLNNYLKKTAPEFKKILEEYFDKGADKKAHREEFKDNPSIVLSLYEEYLKTHEPINDPDEDKDRKKTNDKDE